MISYRETLLSQFDNAPILNDILERFESALATRYLLDSFYALIWDVSTAQGWGLDFWGQIVGVGRVLQISSEPFFGFSQALGAEPFNQAPFYIGASSTENFALSDDAYRTLILMKAMANITEGDIGAINTLLLTLFPNRGNCYIRDNQDMTATYVFDFELSPVEEAIIMQSGVLPRPNGVFVNYEVP